MWFAPMFEDPEKARQRAVRRAESALARKLPWPEVRPVRADRTTAEDVGIIADTYAPHNPLAAIFPEVKAPGENVVSPSGTLRYELRRLPLYAGLPIAAGGDYTDGARAFFDAEIAIPTLHYRKPTTHNPEKWETWMGLTPLEMWSQRSGIRAATGDVVLGGLGMGWLLSEIAAKPTVKSIVVVESDRALLDWFGRQLCATLPKVKDVICADVFAVAQKLDTGKARFILDIWPGASDAKWDRRLRELRATGARCWAWGSPRGES